jgi:heme-degrading monooxygenase HmoA
MASRYPGYISGETLQNVEEPEEYLVISTWKSLAAWKVFFADPKRKAFQDRIDLLQARTTEYKIYQYPESFELPLGESFD